ncbi:MAG TPA: endo-1,4-beta-xylanase [Bosea sp. (in: a-proteobacteria)]|uniref:endo-1,4-beta-xylanase n=1 Tax=Bosea sp. (in: a-proteobacteria) TaxID=1871050 RepID=UPI002E10B2C7|nr:endo-1,4-beta-xylanase [Bosea sp. (in: a-proteobacteria)]
MHRRQFVLGAMGAGLSAGSTSALAQAAAKECSRAAIPYGAAIRVDLLRDDQEYRRAVLGNCQLVVGEGGLKWIDLRPEPGKFHFDHPDRLLAFADANGMRMRGHTLAWYAAMPKWTEAISTKAEAERVLYEHIDTVVGRYKGRIPSWDVVNEAISDNPAVEAPMRKSIWQDLIGTQHVELALRRTAAVDPNAQLVLNDFGFENPTEQCRAKRAAFLRLVRDLKDRDAPLHAIGLQGHLPGEKDIDKDGISSFVAELHGMGLSILVTELDVIDDKLPRDRAIRDDIVASRVRAFLQAVGDVCRPEAVLTWGISDRFTWVPIWFRRKDGEPNRPLPLDANYRPKPMMRVIREFTRAKL